LSPSCWYQPSPAREVLPEQYARADVVHNLSRLALLLSAIKDGRLEDLRVATEDRLHQPYRAARVPGFADILAAASSVGAAGVFLSWRRADAFGASRPRRRGARVGHRRSHGRRGREVRS